LRSFVSFREAMPFFDNDKYKLHGKEREELLELLNSRRPHKTIMKKIDQLQKTKIGIRNPRTQRLKDLEEEKEIFINFYNTYFNKNKLKNKKIREHKKLKKHQSVAPLNLK
jgi:hypothetical protein